MTIRLIIESSQATAVFCALLHVASRPEDLFLDPQEFYMRFAKRIPEGIHFEIEITEPDDVFLATARLHTHISEKTHTPFVCYPLQISTVEDAEEIFQMWCLGSTLMLEQKIDFNAVYDGECRGDRDMFFDVMRDKYKIRVAGVDVRQ